MMKTDKILSRGPKIMKSGKIKAVHDDDLVQLLKSIGEYNIINSGRAKCHFCDLIINFENISAVFPFEKKVAYCCSNPKCYQSLSILGD